MRVVPPARRLLTILAEVAFPARCLGCGRRGVALCSACLRDVPWLSAGVCARCALPTRSLPCRLCARIPPSLTTIVAACAYEGLARKAVHALKFRSGRYLSPTLGALLRQALERRPMTADLVVPVPLAPARLRDRGYNQSALLAEQVAAVVGGSLEPGVLERGDRPPQFTLSAVERRRNMQGAARCTRPDVVLGRRVLLVDDVVTTGATLAACAEALVSAGASHVSALVLARDL